MTETIGFIGLGSMGRPMANNLLAAGFDLRIYNRTPGKAVDLIASGARAVATPVEAVVPGGIVVTMVANDAALEAVTLGVEGIASGLGSGGVHLSMSTVSPQLARRLADVHREHGSHYVAAPVLGRPAAAAAGKLFILLSGSAEAKERVASLLAVMGQATRDLGDDPTQGHVAKLAANFMILSLVEVYAEVLAFAEKNGIGRQDMARLFGDTILNAPLFHLYGELLARENYAPPGFRLALGLKDIELILATGALSRTPTPVADLVHNRLLTAVAKGRSELDVTALALGVSEDAGLRPLS
ncbi:MAG: NAD(P)-dependent oxidoreductase [Candidatus Competibacter sp.]|jgi:3-hydroxyisobutyrate dehydrogenase-like beta-hydroxyacid dehydrogenase|nr:NAD(P)-dependent oxidoreductase [Candidatus Competibacter sp.]